MNMMVSCKSSYDSFLLFFLNCIEIWPDIDGDYVEN